MAGFQLLPLDGGDPINVPDGETVLGRGPFLRVDDKRVSRHHALLENVAGQLQLKPTHVSPCFSQAGPGHAPRPLERDCWHPLAPGIVFSLMPGRYVYRVESSGGGCDARRNSLALEQDADPPMNPPKPPAGPQACSGFTGEDVDQTVGPTQSQTPPTPAAMGKKSNNKKKAEPPEDQSVQTPTPPHITKRVLPAWMTAGVRGSPASTSKGAGRSRQAGGASSCKRAAPKQALVSSEDHEEDEEEKQTPQRKRQRRKTSEDETASPPVDVAIATVSDAASETEEMSSSGHTGPADDADDDDDDDVVIARTTKNGQVPSSGPKMPSSGPAPAPVTARPRSACPYGKDCYRKNPLHFQECSHPGDSDYKTPGEEDEEEDDDRPVCPYGTTCYRKNPLHRKEYKHTKRPARRVTAAARRIVDDDSDDDEYEDSFIDDDSAGDDSDYTPPHAGGDADDEKDLLW